jgi:hypothetical protein
VRLWPGRGGTFHQPAFMLSEATPKPSLKLSHCGSLALTLGVSFNSRTTMRLRRTLSAGRPSSKPRSFSGNGLCSGPRRSEASSRPISQKSQLPEMSFLSPVAFARSVGSALVLASQVVCASSTSRAMLRARWSCSPSMPSPRPTT